nr:MAG TPA: hypothetical protein [Caudoviricetes sp.]DAK58384.1 MAG TPA: hypothetical protein [Caudoviricetes sp.]
MATIKPKEVHLVIYLSRAVVSSSEPDAAF